MAGGWGRVAVASRGHVTCQAPAGIGRQTFSSPAETESRLLSVAPCPGPGHGRTQDLRGSWGPFLQAQGMRPVAERATQKPGQ